MTGSARGKSNSRLGSEAVTEGIRIRVSPSYLADQSDPHQRQFFFAYRIRISNEGERPAMLVLRHWLIVDAHGRSEEVTGPGVVGKQPRLAPGESFEYSSYCPLTTPWGTMEGRYTMRRDDGREFDAAIGRFYLVSKPEPGVHAPPSEGAAGVAPAPGVE